MKFEIYQNEKKEWQWRLWAANNSDIIADSGEGYKNERDCRHGINLVKESSEAPVYNESGTQLDLGGVLDEDPRITAADLLKDAMGK